ncbi:MAG: lysophospholipid acyltransferase family protein [Planctomycetes bacterium]|nr:lysophospholipid acyltransferase family protein [Planctomycetota bacterium]
MTDSADLPTGAAEIPNTAGAPRRSDDVRGGPAPGATPAPRRGRPVPGEPGWASVSTGSFASRVLGRFYFLGDFWYRFHYWGIRHRVMGLPINAIFVPFFFVFLRRICSAIASNLEPVLGPTSWWRGQRRAFRTMWQWASCRSSRYEYLQPGIPPPDLELDGIEHWNALTSRPEGFVIVTAHVGNYEAGGIIPNDLIRRRLHQVRNVEPDPRAQAFVEELLARHSPPEHVTHFVAEEDFPHVKMGVQLLKALRAGELVAMPGDRVTERGGVVETRLFGRPFFVPEGPFGIARTADVPLISIYLFNEGRRRFRLAFRPPIEIPRTADRIADRDAAARRYVADLEWAIRQRPHQWFCFRDAYSD